MTSGYPPQPSPGILLTQNSLVMQQTTGFMSNNFDILDGAGERAVGHVTTSGSGVSRFFAGSRSLHVADADGTPLLHVADPMGLGFDRFEITTPDGAALAAVTKKFAFFSTKVAFSVTDGTQLELFGNFIGMDFEFRVQGRVAAHVSRKWAGFGRGFLGRSRYQVTIDPAVPPQLRLTIIGGCIVLDLIRAKQENNG